jgi:hypothetical protein
MRPSAEVPVAYRTTGCVTFSDVYSTDVLLALRGTGQQANVAVVCGLARAETPFRLPGTRAQDGFFPVYGESS